ncbi:MAG: hypothetical protein EOQ55_15140 [Mesorhizobium sp.]|uniref:hypothetical protein n=1 Tax=Mesorhizobium sp. TaxID=1871066 RepID=UPI000FE46EB3|nr:hypothetical protein [Mesorhizobium sp.]RWG19414.1 MAG: hypothetical protein EOQ55_15140 [Mesorhizobium sp.]RWI86537.1 MAG: hypothetical protein EOR21_29165 [Mesorhizobium sp.]
MIDNDGRGFDHTPRDSLGRAQISANDDIGCFGRPAPRQTVTALVKTAEGEVTHSERTISVFEGEFARSFREREMLDARNAQLYRKWCTLVSDWNREATERAFEYQMSRRRELMENELEIRAEEKMWIKRKKDLLRRALAELEG